MSFASGSDNSSSMKKRKTMKSSTYEELDAALLEWASHVRSESTKKICVKYPNNSGCMASGIVLMEDGSFHMETPNLEKNCCPIVTDFFKNFTISRYGS